MPIKRENKTSFPERLTLVITKAGAIDTVATDQQTFKVRVPADGYRIEEVQCTLETAPAVGLEIQLAEMTEADVFIADVYTSTIDFGTSSTVTKGAPPGSRDTPDKDHWFRLDVDVADASAADLTVQVRMIRETQDQAI